VATRRDTSVRSVLIEDNVDDQRFADRFQSAGLPCEVLAPSPSKEDLVANVLRGKFDLVILDYRLDDAQGIDYRGGSVAAELKERDPLLPLVLFTAAEKRVNFARRNPTLSELFDFVVEKESAQTLDDRRRLASQLADLARGYKRVRSSFIRSKSATPQEILERSMGAREGELPDQTHTSSDADAAVVVRRVLKYLLRFPGPLIDASKARALLGLTERSFRRTEVTDWLADARYSGIFSTMFERWWRSRLQEQLIAASDDGIPVLSVDRARNVATACGLRSLKAGKCNWCARTDTGDACEVCGESVDGTHCLTATDEDRPSWADPYVVCFRCIQLGRAQDAMFIGPSQSIARKIANGTIEPEPENGS